MMFKLARNLLTALAMSGAAALVHAETLYNPQVYRPLAADKHAHLPGDAVTVLIYETSSSSTTAGTNMQRGSSVGLRASADQRSHQGAVGANATFDGGGTIQRSDNLLAQITVTVTKVEANGDLWISGEQLVEINADKQRIKLEGRVRALDISSSNTVLSNRVADAKITYAGDGDLAAHQKVGWLSRFFAWAGL